MRVKCSKVGVRQQVESLRVYNIFRELYIMLQNQKLVYINKVQAPAKSHLNLSSMSYAYLLSLTPLINLPGIIILLTPTLCPSIIHHWVLVPLCFSNFYVQGANSPSHCVAVGTLT